MTRAKLPGPSPGPSLGERAKVGLCRGTLLVSMLHTGDSSKKEREPLPAPSTPGQPCPWVLGDGPHSGRGTQCLGIQGFLLSCFQFPGFPGGSAGKESACNAGDLGSIPGLGTSPGEANGYPLQYSSLENPMDCNVHGVTKSRTRLSDFHLLELGRSLLSSCFSVPQSSLLEPCMWLQRCPGPGLPWGSGPCLGPSPLLPARPHRAACPERRRLRLLRGWCVSHACSAASLGSEPLIQPGPPNPQATVTSRRVPRQHHGVGSRNERQGSGEAFPTPLGEQAAVMRKAGRRLAP